MVASEKLSMGHARVLSKLENPSKIIEMANMIVSNKMPVRDIENMTNHNQVAKKVEISFTNVADLNRLLEIMNVKE